MGNASARIFADSNEAQLRYTELEGEFHAASGTAALRATRLTDEQVAIAGAGFLLWLEPTMELREKTKINLRNRVGNFIKGVANKRVTDVMP